MNLSIIFVPNEYTFGSLADLPGILTRSPVPKDFVGNCFFFKTECASIDRFILLEQTTATFGFPMMILRFAE